MPTSKDVNDALRRGQKSTDSMARGYLTKYGYAINDATPSTVLLETLGKLVYEHVDSFDVMELALPVGEVLHALHVLCAATGVDASKALSQVHKASMRVHGDPLSATKGDGYIPPRVDGATVGRW